MDPIYIGLLVLRFLLVFIPQYGYIHPDEFFQTTEVISGDIFNIEVNKPWEYTVLPIRSVSLIYIFFGLPLKFLKLLGEFEPAVISPYWIIVIPRLVIASLSLVLDYTLCKLCRCFDLNEQIGLRLMAASYVMLTYMTRTFTNSIEAVLFAVLLLLVFTDRTIKFYVKSKFEEEEEEKQENLQRVSMKDYRFKIIKHAEAKLHYTKSLTTTFYVKATLIGIVGMAGMFNRPTFAIMALFPALMYCEAKQEKITTHAVFVGAGATVSFITLTAVDTLYFGENFQELLSQCDKEKTSVLMCFFTTFLRWVVITPYNFLLYNMNPLNLAEHGIHPRYLHFIVNLPLLFGPLTLLIYKKLLHLSVLLWRQEKFHKSYLPLVMLLIPVILISTFPHQEPRFLLPVLPLAVMIGIEQIQEKSKLKTLFVCFCLFFNIIMTPIYGFLHQGGVIQSLLHIQKDLKSGTSLFDIHDKFVYHRTYMPPHCLLLSRTSKSQILDIQGGNIQHFLKIVPQRLSEIKDFPENKKSSNIYVVTPSVFVDELRENGVNFTTVTVMFGHLTTEDPPNVATISNSSKKHQDIIERIKEFLNQMTLHIIRVPYEEFFAD
ncbi:GPI mannosyltransferase 4-like [Mytilus californianus]|uniref:GPI mannosyltransferase 4-like n=1 Tax=Mytilus californianus TaxID=6549 RepID=UPI0022472A0D|nr:GPI mannosyltransferase 4-like [Mytilus californianus]